MPDDERRQQARQKMNDDLHRMRMGVEDQLAFRLHACRTENERYAVCIKHYPDLEAEIVYFGTLLSIRYVPEQWALHTSPRGTGTRVRLCDAKWVALVTTEHGTTEMDPTILRIMWPSAPGDPLFGVVDAEELAQRIETDRDEREVAAIKRAQRAQLARDKLNG